MTVYSWPDTRPFQPQGQELRVVDNTQRTAESSLSGYVQTTSMPGARWAWGLDMAPDTRADRAALEAFLLRLSGKQHRVQLWDLRNPRPRGNIRLSGVTLGASAAQFATTLTLAGCLPARNLLTATQAFDSAAWQKSSATVTANTSVAPDGTTTADTLQATSLSGVFQYVTVTPLTQYTFSWWAKRSADSAVAYRIYNDTTKTDIVASTSYYASINASTWVRMSVSFTPPAGCTAVRVYPCAYITGGAHGVIAWGAQLEVGAAATDYSNVANLLAGDWVGLPNGQLLRVVADATATEAGAMTVEVRHMLRSAVASGAAITLDKPSALYVRTESGIALPRMPGNAEPGMSLDLVEVFA